MHGGLIVAYNESQLRQGLAFCRQNQKCGFSLFFWRMGPVLHPETPSCMPGPPWAGLGPVWKPHMHGAACKRVAHPICGQRLPTHTITQAFQLMTT